MFQVNLNVHTDHLLKSSRKWNKC